MTAEAAPLPILGLAAIAARYRAILCDVWGVLHNGIVAYREAGAALARFRADGGVVLLISNAPRPAGPVIAQMDAIGVDRAAYDGLITSGDVSADVLRGYGPTRVYHLGPDRDLPLYEGLEAKLSDIDSADLVCCTGLVDDEVETVADYAGILERLAARGLTMVCANPDLVVERGSRLIPCAGAMAAAYEKLGGRTVVIGKPLPVIYDSALARIDRMAGRPLPRAEVLAIGDGAGTDIRGANGARLEALYISGGIHAREGGDAAAVLRRHGAHALATMQRLAW